MSIRLSALIAGGCLFLSAAGCDSKATRTTTTTEQTPTGTTNPAKVPATPRVGDVPPVDRPAGDVEVRRGPDGLNVDVEPRRPGDSKVDVNIGGPGGVRVDVDGKSIGERVQERREERLLNEPVAP